MSMMYSDAEVNSLGYQAGRMELERATTGPSYDTPAAYVARVACRAAALAPTPRDLGLIVATVRRWLAGRSAEEEAEELLAFNALVASRPFEPDLSPARCAFV